MKLKKHICILVLSALLITLVCPAFSVGQDGEDGPALDPSAVPQGLKPGEEFAYSLNMLRVVKNRFYNAAEAALAEDTSLSHLLYRLFDFVYADYVLDAFADCMGDGSGIMHALKARGCIECGFLTNHRDMAIGMGREGDSHVIYLAEFDRETRAATLRILVGGRESVLFQWHPIRGGFALQYLYPSDDEGISTGYRAIIYGDAAGEVYSGLRCPDFAKSSFNFTDVGDMLVSDIIFGYDKLVLTSERITLVTASGREYEHIIGDVPEPSEEPGTGEEP